MPSRPVLIGRGLVTQTLNKNHKRADEHHVRVHTPDTQATQQSLAPHPCHTRQGHHTGGHQSYGGHSERETPGPIPNPEVKPFSADGTATERLWESRTPPDIHSVVEATVRWPLLISAPFAGPTPGADSRGRAASQSAPVR